MKIIWDSVLIKAVEDRWNSGMPKEQLFKEVGITQNEFMRGKREGVFNIKDRPKRLKPVREFWSKEMVARVYDARKKGVSEKDIPAMLGITDRKFWYAKSKGVVA